MKWKWWWLYDLFVEVFFLQWTPESEVDFKHVDNNDDGEDDNNDDDCD